jgi:hypothetical protein
MSRASSVYHFDIHDSPKDASVYRNLPTAMEIHVPPIDVSEPVATPVRDVICGSTKMVGGCLAFPVLCPLNVVAGTVMTVYGCLCCRICDRRFENQRNEFCHHCGVTAATRISTSLITSGLSEFRQTCCVNQEMVR